MLYYIIYDYVSIEKCLTSTPYSFLMQNYDDMKNNLRPKVTSKQHYVSATWTVLSDLGLNTHADHFENISTEFRPSILNTCLWDFPGS